MATYCQMCGLVLTDAESIKLGMGPDCAARYGTQSAQVARVVAQFTDAATGAVTHPRLERHLLRLRAAERAVSEGRGGLKAVRDAGKYRTFVANFGTSAVKWEVENV